MEDGMLRNDDFPGTHVNYEAFRSMADPLCGRHNLADEETSTFTGSVRLLSVSGLTAVDIRSNARRVERTQRDVRLDGVDQYKAVFQIEGRSIISQNDQVVQLALGGVALVDLARPVTHVSDDVDSRWLCLLLPRRSLVSHLGFEPPGGACGHGGTPAGRLLYEVVLDAFNGGGSVLPPADSYMRLAVFDLLGALFVRREPPPSSSRHANKLIARISSLIKDRFTDPDFGPPQAASEAGISLRYLQKLFTQSGTTCTEYIHSLRLDYAARLLHRKKLLRMSEPISSIAYACGFRDYTHFARQFRNRFGCSPGAHSGIRPLLPAQLDL
jgi:AraC family transcriptional regulator, positive regulator of tynA and feaB